MIVIHDYKPNWPQEFEAIRASLLKTLEAARRLYPASKSCWSSETSSRR